MKWSDIKASIQYELSQRSLKQPSRRLSELERMECSLEQCFPEFCANPGILIVIGRQDVSRKLAQLNGTSQLNGAARSLLSQIFEKIASFPDISSESVERAELDRPIAEKDSLKVGLPPIVNAASRVLILGTLPSDRSIHLQQYYANPRNRFWDILSDVYGETIETSYESRREFLIRKGLALWDVLLTASRSGSTDRAIKDGTPNDIPSLLRNYPNLRAIVLNGGEASTQLSKLKIQFTGRLEVLPSTSPAPGKYVQPLHVKVARWRILTRL